MKKVIVILVLVLSTAGAWASGNSTSSVRENTEKYLQELVGNKGVSVETAYRISDALYAELSSDLKKRGFGEPDVRICTSIDDSMSINLHEGFWNDGSHEYYALTVGAMVLEKESVPVLVFCAMLCHEYGHLLGQNLYGQPVSSKKERVFNDDTAPEGEADYQSLRILARLVRRIPWILNGSSLDRAKILEAKIFVEKNSDGISKRRLAESAMLIAASHMALSRDNTLKLSLFKPDNSKVSSTLHDYPSRQARLDSAAAGLLNLPRPRSWYFSETVIK